MQIALQVDNLGKDQYKFFNKKLDMGDFIGVEGKVFTTHKGEISILVEKFTLLTKSLRPLPEKFHGIRDQDDKFRKRWPYISISAWVRTKLEEALKNDSLE